MTDRADKPGSTVVTATVGRVADQPVGSMRLAHIGEHSIAVIRTASGVHAIDDACPHQGHRLTTGDLDGDVVTCRWHNWKYDVSDGRCLRGAQDVERHRVDVIDGTIHVTVVSSSPSARPE